MSDALSNTRDDKSDKVFQVLIMSETLAKKMEEISSKLTLEAIEEKIKTLNLFVRLLPLSLKKKVYFTLFQ